MSNISETAATPVAAFIGDASIDHYYSLDRWPCLGDKSALTWMGDLHGGMIANAASVFAALGAHVGAVASFHAALRPSPLTQMLEEQLQQHGLVTRIHHDPELPDAVTFVYTVGDNNTIMWPSLNLTNFPLSEEQVAEIRTARYLYSTPVELRPIRVGNRGCQDLLTELRDSGVEIWLDLDVGDLLEEDKWMLSLADVVLVNSFGLERLTSPSQSGLESLLTHGVGSVIVTRGAAGIVVHEQGGTETEVASLSVRAIDATGAGDTLGGATLLARSQGLGIVDAVRVGNTAAAFAVTKIGGRGAAVEWEQLEDFARQVNPEIIPLLEEIGS